MTNSVKTEKEKKEKKKKRKKRQKNQKTKPIAGENFSKLRETTLIPFTASSNASQNTGLPAETVENLIK